MSAGKWYHEDLGHGEMHSMTFGAVLYSATTPFQKVEVLDTEPFGHVLMLDGVLNSAEKDEYIYHESLVQPAMLAHPHPRTVFIGGGGEGATLREVLRHPSVEKAVMVDIDGDLVEVFRRDLPQYPQGAFDDPRTELIFDDAKKQLEEYDGLFDVIVLDLADPVEAGPAFPLWTREYALSLDCLVAPSHGPKTNIDVALGRSHTTCCLVVQLCCRLRRYYETCSAKMAPDGVLVTQAGPFSVNQVSEVCTPVAKTLGAVFPTVLTYGAHVPSFGHTWAYNLAIKGGNHPASTYAERPAALVDRNLAERLGAATAAALGWYDGLTHAAMFSLPKPVRLALEAETRVVTLQTPLAFVAGAGLGQAKL
jgi:thermospermine synthase